MIAKIDYNDTVLQQADFTDSELTAIKKCLEPYGNVRVYTPDGLQRELENFENQLGGISACNAIPAQLLAKIKNLTCSQRYNLLREIIKWD